MNFSHIFYKNHHSNIIRAAARRTRLSPPESPHSSALPLPDPGSPVSSAVAVASSLSDEYFSPPKSPTHVRRQIRGRPPRSLGLRGQPAPSRAPATGGCVQRLRLAQSINENIMRAYFVRYRTGNLRDPDGLRNFWLKWLSSSLTL